jgi:hypothetical protein
MDKSPFKPYPKEVAMSVNFFQTKANEQGLTNEAKTLSFDLSRSATKQGLPEKLTGEIFPGVTPEPGENPLSSQPCRLVLRGLISPTRVSVRDHRGREIASREVRHSPDVLIRLTMLREVVSYSDLKIELRPIVIPAQRAAS